MILIRYYKNIILENSMEISQIKDILSKGMEIHNIYALCVSPYTNGLIEIMLTKELVKTVNSYGDYGIIALVKGENKAKKILQGLITDWLKCHSDLSGFKGHYNINCF